MRCSSGAPRPVWLVLALILIPASWAAGQRPAPSWGVAVGVNYTSLNPGDVDGRPGGAAGLVATLPLSAPLAIRAEGLLSRRGFRYTTGGCPFFFGCTPDQLVPPSTATTTLTRLDLPVLLEWHTTGGGIRPFLQLGPFASLHLRCGGRLERVGFSTSYSCGEDFRPISFGAAAGAGIIVGRLAVGLRLIRDLGDLTGPVPADGSSLFSGARVTTLALQVEVRDLLR